MGIKWKEDYSVETQRNFGIIIGLICGFLGVAVFELFRSKNIAWAAWIQSIGSVIAILVAVLVAYYQSRVSRKMFVDEWHREKIDEKYQRKVKLRAIVRAMRTCGQAAVDICGEISSCQLFHGTVRRAQKLKLQVVLDWLSNIPISTEPGMLISSEMLSLKLRMLQVQDILERADEEVPLDKSNMILLSNLVEHISSLLKEVRKRAGKYDGELIEFLGQDCD